MIEETWCSRTMNTRFSTSSVLGWRERRSSLLGRPILLISVKQSFPRLTLKSLMNLYLVPRKMIHLKKVCFKLTDKISFLP